MAPKIGQMCESTEGVGFAGVRRAVGGEPSRFQG